MRMPKLHKTAAPLAFGAYAGLATVWAQALPQIMRLAPDGPEGKGLSEPLAKVSFYSGERAYTYRYYQAPSSKESAGIWASDSAHGGIHRATNTEVFHLNAGRVRLADKSGREETFQAGDTVLLPRGAEFAWKRSEDVKEYFAVFDFEPTANDARSGPGETLTFAFGGGRGAGSFCDRNHIVSLGGDYRHDIDHSVAPEKQGNCVGLKRCNGHKRLLGGVCI